MNSLLAFARKGDRPCYQTRPATGGGRVPLA